MRPKSLWPVRAHLSFTVVAWYGCTQTWWMSGVRHAFTLIAWYGCTQSRWAKRSCWSPMDTLSALEILFGYRATCLDFSHSPPWSLLDSRASGCLSTDGCLPEPQGGHPQALPGGCGPGFFGSGSPYILPWPPQGIFTLSPCPFRVKTIFLNLWFQDHLLAVARVPRITGILSRSRGSD